jgi:hypothetical protein
MFNPAATSPAGRAARQRGRQPWLRVHRQTGACRWSVVFALILLSPTSGLSQQQGNLTGARNRAADYLAIEVPRWKQDNGCYSCHNNGDAARALMAAARADVLGDTLEWLRQPGKWNAQQSDAPFRDKNLARIQFSLALAEASQRGLLKDREPLREAARLLAPLQSPDGSWSVEDEANVGSPATYGSALATYAAMRVLTLAADPSLETAWRRAGKWLAENRSAATPDIAARLLAEQLDVKDDASWSANRERLIRSQNPDGGWGPYRATPSEVFDTAIALLALRRAAADGATRRGISFLLAAQLAHGGWPATTRPSGVSSYAQHISTTGWALLALIDAAERE